MGSLGAEVEGDNSCHPVCSIAPFVSIGWKGIYSGSREKIEVWKREGYSVTGLSISLAFSYAKPHRIAYYSSDGRLTCVRDCNQSKIS